MIICNFKEIFLFFKHDEYFRLFVWNFESKIWIPILFKSFI